MVPPKADTGRMDKTFWRGVKKKGYIWLQLSQLIDEMKIIY